MKEQTFNRPFGNYAPVTQPDFEDERTLLTARRVVPLSKIEAKQLNRRYWILAGALVIAMMLGSGSALVASYLKLRNIPSTVSEVSKVETPSTPLAVVNPVANELSATENAENTEVTPTPVAPRRAKPKAAPRNTELTRPRVVREMDEEEALKSIRDVVLYDEWQERRARRAARRERRNRVDHHDRDLSNLDEIFEGPRRRPLKY